MAGWRPVVEIMFVDFVTVAMDMLVNPAAKLATFSNGRWQAPLVVRAACGGGYGDAGQHEQALWGLLAGVPGLSVVVPSTPADAAGLMLARPARSGPVLPAARRRAAAFAVLYAAVGALALVELWGNHASEGDLVVYPFAVGIFGTWFATCLRVTLHRNVLPRVPAEAPSEDGETESPTVGESTA